MMTALGRGAMGHPTVSSHHASPSKAKGRESARRAMSGGTPENSLCPAGVGAVLQRVLDQRGRRSDAELLHHVVLVKGDRSRGDLQDVGDLLHRVPLRG